MTIFFTIIFIVAGLTYLYHEQIRKFYKEKLVPFFKWLTDIFFVEIPSNHVVAVMIGKRFIRILANLEDKTRLLEVLDGMKKAIFSKHQFAIVVPGTPSQEVDELELMIKNANEIVCREENLPVTIKIRLWRREFAVRLWNPFNWIAYMCFKHFNLHLKSWNPFIILGEIKVIRKEINETFDAETDDFDQRVVRKDPGNGIRKTNLLRLSFPRVGTTQNVMLKGQIPIDIAWSCTELFVIDPKRIFVRNPDLSAWVDDQIQQFFTQFLGRKDLDTFETADLGANRNSELNRAAREERVNDEEYSSGISSAGVKVIGTLAITAWRPDPSQKPLTDAKTEYAASVAKLGTAENLAKAAASMIKATGTANAEAEGQMGEVKAKNARLLGEELKKSPALANVIAMQSIGESGAGTIVLGQGAMPTIPIAPTPPSNQDRDSRRDQRDDYDRPHRPSDQRNQTRPRDNRGNNPQQRNPQRQQPPRPPVEDEDTDTPQTRPPQPPYKVQ